MSLVLRAGLYACSLVFVAVSLSRVLPLVEPVAYVNTWCARMLYPSESFSLDAASRPDDDPGRLRGEYTIRFGDRLCDVAQTWRLSCSEVTAANKGRFKDLFSVPVGLSLYLPLRNPSGGNEP